MNTSPVALGALQLPPVEEAPKQALVVVRNPAAELKAAHAASDELFKTSQQVAKFEHKKPFASKWGWPVALSVVGAAAASFVSVEVAAAIAGAGALAGGTLRAMLPSAMRRTKAVEVRAVTSTLAATPEAGTASASIAARDAARILHSLDAKGINDPLARAALQKLIDQHANATPEEKNRAELWSTIIYEAQQGRDNDNLLNAFHCLELEEREAAAAAIYDEIFGNRPNYYRSTGDYEELFAELRSNMPSIYPEPAAGVPTSAGTDKRKLLTEAIRVFDIAMRNAQGDDRVTPSAEVYAIASGNKPPEEGTLRGSLDYFFAPARTDLERCFAGLLVQAQKHLHGHEMRAAFQALLAIEKAQPESAKADARRLFDAMSTVTDGNLRSGQFAKTVTFLDKLDAAEVLGIESRLL